MKITDEMVDYVAELSRLRVRPSEREQLAKELGGIIGYMDILNNLNTETIEPMSHIFAMENVFREDVVEPSFDRELMLAGAPVRDEESLIVPKTVE